MNERRIPLIDFGHTEVSLIGEIRQLFARQIFRKTRTKAKPVGPFIVSAELIKREFARCCWTPTI